MRRTRTLAAIAAAVLATLLPSALDAGPGDVAPEPGAGSGGFRVLASRTFQGDDGHLYTTSDLEVDGVVRRGVTAPGGRLGDRWEWVESFPALGASEGHGAHEDGVPSAADYRLQAGAAAGTTVVAESSTATAAASPSTYTTLYGYGWCADNLDAPYRINPARGPSGSIGAVRGGFNVWTNHPDSWMSFAWKGTTSIAKASRTDGVNVVWFSYSSDSILGRTWVYGSGSRITGFDMHLNTKYPLTIGGTGYDLQTLVAHEAGHAAGFGHTSAWGNLMYGGGQPPSTLWRSLGGQDRAGLSSLYPYGSISARRISVTGPGALAPGQTGRVTATFENLGRTPWGGRFPALRIRTASPKYRASAFAGSGWLDATFPTRSFASTCQGERVTVSWTLKAPAARGTYTETFSPVAGDSAHTRWMTGSNVVLSLPVSGSGSSSGSSGGDDGGGTCFLFFC